MSEARTIDTLCQTCGEVQEHLIADDPGICECIACGTVQTLVSPVN